ncbi:MAG: glycosyltransferase WbuB [Alphaproteobacteria bacterium]|nr:MAG: glycosyltransferase WbuB [Alphaproteobacteria bacterium]
MNILFLSDNFPPETNAIANRVYERALHWVRDGHKVTVVTSVPNFPEGIVHEGYENKWYQEEDYNGIHVVRVKTYITANEGFVKRTLDFLSFMVTGFWGLLRQDKPDVLAVTSPQFFNSIAGWAAARIKRVPFVLEIGDLWPASIVAVGGLKPGLTIRMLEMLELFMYRQATRIIPVTHSFKKYMMDRGIDGSKIDVVRNGVELDNYRPLPRDEKLAEQLGLTDKFVFGYIGTLGMAHGLQNVLDTAKILLESDDPTARTIAILFVGAGAEFNPLREKAQAMGLDNITFVSRQPKKEIPRYWSLCDVSLVHLKNTPAMSEVIPSKIFEAMAMGKPILIGAPAGEATGIVTSENAGTAIISDDPHLMAKTMMKMATAPERLETFRQNALKAAPSYSRRRQAELYLESLERAIASRLPAPGAV